MYQGQNFPKYRCHKLVQAFCIASVVVHADLDPNADDAAFEGSDQFEGAHLFPVGGGPPVAVDAAWYRKHNPKAGGYFVVYEDGYTSWSPAKAFEEGYHLEPGNRSSAGDSPTFVDNPQPTASVAGGGTPSANPVASPTPHPITDAHVANINSTLGLKPKP